MTMPIHAMQVVVIVLPNRRCWLSHTKRASWQERKPLMPLMSDRWSRYRFLRRAWTVLSVTGVCLSVAAAAAPVRNDVIGSPQVATTRQEDTLLDVAVNNDLGYIEIRAANPAIDPWIPGNGSTIVLPTRHVLPDAPRRGIVINLPELRLYYFPSNGGDPRSFPIGIGGEGKETPVGRTEVVRKTIHPVWIPTPA